MVDKLGEIGSVFSDIHRAVKIAKSLQEKNSQLESVIEQTKKQSDELEKLQIPGEPILDELKSKVRKVRDSAAKMETWFVNFGKEINLFERFVRNKIQGQSIPRAVMEEFCDSLRRIHSMATGFSESFEGFIKNLSKSQDTAIKMADRMKQKEQELQNQASSAATKGGLGTASLAITGVGLVALGFFTGGAAWVAAGVAAGSVCAAGAVAVGVKTTLDVKKLHELAGGILKDANTLEAIGKNLKGISDKAGEIKMDKEALEALQTALDFFMKDQEKDRKIAELEARLAAAGIE